MFSEIKSLIKHGSIYTIGNILSKIASFLLIPIYTNYLIPSEYGTLELLDLTIDMIATVLGMGMAIAVMRYYSKAEDKKSKNLVLSSALIGIITLMGLTSAICIVFSPLFSKIIFSSEQYTYFFRIIFLTMFLHSGIGMSIVFLRAKLKSGTFVTLNLIKLIIQLSLNIYFLVALGLGVLGVLYSGLITSFIFFTYLLISTFRETGTKFSFKTYKLLLKFGAPLIIADLSIFLLTFADRFFLNYFCDLNIVGIYSLAYKFGMLVAMLICGPFWAIWSVKMFELAKQDNAQELFSKTMNYFLMGALTISLALAILTKDVLRLMANSSYWEAYKIVPLISTSYVLQGFIGIAGAGILIKGKTKYKAISSFAAMAANLLLNYLFIPIWGGFGAAFATLIAFGVRLLIDFYYSQRLFYINYDWKKIMLMTGMYLFLALTAFYVDIENLIISVAINILILFMFPISLYIFGILEPKEKNIIRSFVNNPFKSLKTILKT